MRVRVCTQGCGHSHGPVYFTPCQTVAGYSTPCELVVFHVCQSHMTRATTTCLPCGLCLSLPCNRQQRCKIACIKCMSTSLLLCSAGQGRTRLYVGGKPLLVTADIMVGLPVPDEALAEFTPEQRNSLREYARLVSLLKEVRPVTHTHTHSHMDTHTHICRVVRIRFSYFIRYDVCCVRCEQPFVYAYAWSVKLHRLTSTAVALSGVCVCVYVCMCVYRLLTQLTSRSHGTHPTQPS